MRMARRMLAAGGVSVGGGVGPERHYLPFNGSTNVGVALNSITVASPTTALVLKLYDRVGLGNAYPRMGCLLDGATNPVVTALYSNPATAFGVGGYSTNATTGGLLPNVVANTVAADINGEQVVAARYKSNASQRLDVFAVQAGATLATAGSNAGEARTPLHVCIGAQRTDAGAPFDFAAIKLIAALVVDSPTEAELQAYSLTRDARTVWGAARLLCYYAASQRSGTSIPNLGSSAVALTLSGTLAALVPL